MPRKKHSWVSNVVNCSESECPICLAGWTMTDDHRVCCLKCGHLFGRSCIERWLSDNFKNPRCWICDKAAHPSDIRNLSCRIIKASDYPHMVQLMSTVDSIRLQGNNIITILSRLEKNPQTQLCLKEIEILTKELTREQGESHVLRMQLASERYKHLYKPSCLKRLVNLVATVFGFPKKHPFLSFFIAVAAYETEVLSKMMKIEIRFRP